MVDNTNNTLDSISLDISQYKHLKPTHPREFPVKNTSQNGFFIYRNIMVKLNNEQEQRQQCDMPTLSKIASKFWKEEPNQVKEEYKRLAKEVNESLHIPPLAVEFCEGMHFNEYLPMSIPPDDNIISGTCFLPPGFNASMPYFYPFHFSSNQIKETSISCNLDHFSFSNSIENSSSNISGNSNTNNHIGNLSSNVSENSNTNKYIENLSSKGSGNNNHLKSCDCECQSCKNRIQSLEDQIQNLNNRIQSLENRK
ncbi:4977_t:CDS:1 [Ambispora gerdemannii]|uniref:4977_t:CDS:1 n=1 Tax=Ambispora gerdemannii TaxID=144530 RepID=A0A9N8WLB2_9GLOM|nr:4977_t:CDS:1 [Ambispora gerdemannii]